LAQDINYRSTRVQKIVVVIDWYRS